MLSKLCATFTSLILTKPQPVLGSDAGNQPPAPDPSRLGGVLSAARLGVHEAQTFRNGPAVRFRNRPSRVHDQAPTAWSLIGADVRQIRECWEAVVCKICSASILYGLSSINTVYHRSHNNGPKQGVCLRSV